MSIGTYSELKTAIANWTARADLSSGRDDEFIDNVEARFNRRLRIRAMEASTTGTTTEDEPTITLPTDFFEMRSFLLTVTTNNPKQLRFITTGAADGLEYGEPGVPDFYTFAGGAIRLYPTPDAAYTYTLRYYTKIPALSASQTTNYILTNFPDVYLWGCRFEAYSYALDIESAAAAKQMYEEAIKEIERHDGRERYAGPPVILLDPLLVRGGPGNITTDA